MNTDQILLLHKNNDSASYKLKNFLVQNLVSFRALDCAGKDAEEMEAEGIVCPPEDQLPAIVVNGAVYHKPSYQVLASIAGYHTSPYEVEYDLAIIGGGPSGFAAAIMAASEGLRTVILESHAIGGQAAGSSRIENFLGFPAGISGLELTRLYKKQAEKFGVEFLLPFKAVKLERDSLSNWLFIEGENPGQHLFAKAVILAFGVQYKRLDGDELKKYEGRGIYYGASKLDATHSAGKDVVVIGGANSAGQAAVNFSRYAKSVTMLIRGERIDKTMSSYLVNQIMSNPAIRVISNANLEEVHGAHEVEWIKIKHYEKTELIQTDSIYVFIGATPNTSWLPEPISFDRHGFVLTQGSYETDMQGVFAVGDVRHESVKRVAGAVGEGAAVIPSIHKYLDFVKEGLDKIKPNVLRFKSQ